MGEPAGAGAEEEEGMMIAGLDGVPGGLVTGGRVPAAARGVGARAAWWGLARFLLPAAALVCGVAWLAGASRSDHADWARLALLAFLLGLAARERDGFRQAAALALAAVPGALLVAHGALPLGLSRPLAYALLALALALVGGTAALDKVLALDMVDATAPDRVWLPAALLQGVACAGLVYALWQVARPGWPLGWLGAGTCALSALAVLVSAGLVDRPLAARLRVRLPARARLKRPWARPAVVAVAVVVLVAIAEIVVAYGDPRYGLGLHITLLALALGLAARETAGARQAFFLAATVGPIIRIVSTGMPLRSFPEPYWYVLTSVPLFLTAYLIARECGLRPAAIGLRLPALGATTLDMAVGLSGVGLGYVEWRILRPGPLVDGRSVGWLLAGAAIMLVCTGLVEEVLFRGVILRIAERYLGGRGGLLFSAAIFAVLHIGHLSVLDDIFVAGVGLYFGLVVRRTRSLFGVTLAHGAINIMLFIVLPLSLIPHVP